MFLLKTKLPLGDMHSYEDRIAPPEIEAIKITRPAKSPERIAYEKAVARYRERVTVTPNKIETYLQHHMNDQGEIKGSDLPINSLDDFFIFERLRSLEFLEGGVLASDWSVDQISGRIDNEWISCRDFLIRRAA